MRFRLPPSIVLLVLLVVCGSVIAVVAWRRSQSSSMAELYDRLPPGDAPVVYIDFDGLRRSGVLGMFAGSDMVQEPEYRAFVEQSGFDYLRDLNGALVAFYPRATYMVLRGRFDWKSLSTYVTKQGGDCNNMFCRLAGSAPDRRISFVPLGTDVMGLAVSPDEWAVSILMGRKRTAHRPFPSSPLWARLPASSLSQSDAKLPGTRMFATALDGADNVLLSAGPAGDGLELRLDAACGSPEGAAAVAARLAKTTELLRVMIARENKQPNPADISGLLTAGSFKAEDRTVIGLWPLRRELLQSLAEGRY